MTTYDEITAVEFSQSFGILSFGRELRASVLDADRRGATKAWFPLLSAIAEQKLERVPVEAFFEDFGLSDNVVKSNQDMWLGCVFSLQLQPAIDILIRTEDWDPTFDVLWFHADLVLWNAAKEIEREPGALAKRYGLVDPSDPNRPLRSRQVLQDLQREKEREEGEHQKKVDAPVKYESNIQVAAPQDSVAKAPERPTEEDAPKRTRRKKNKGKTADEAGEGGPSPAPEPLDPFVEENPKLPEMLPTEYKLSRKNTNVRGQCKRLSIYQITQISYRFFIGFLGTKPRRGRSDGETSKMWVHIGLTGAK